jgi:hypothetical protein
VRKQLPALAALVDVWWTGDEQDLEHAGLSTRWRGWAKEYLLPRAYWAHHVAHTHCARRKATRRLTTTCSPGDFPSRPWRSGRCGPASAYAPFSGPRSPSKAAMALSRKGIITIADCHNNDTRRGPCCITVIVEPWMARRQPLAFSVGGFQTSLRPYSPTWPRCPDLGNANAKLGSGVDVLNCPALSGYPGVP